MLEKRWRTIILGFCLALILVVTPNGLTQPDSRSSPATENSISSVTVELDDRPLLVVKTKGLAPSIDERASDIKRRIEQFAKSTVSVEALNTLDTEGATLVGAENELLFGITDEDAKAVGKTRQALAKESLQKLRQAVERYREQRSIQSRIRASIIAIVSTIGLLLLLTLLNNIAPQIYQWLDEQRNRRIPNIRIQSLELVSSSQLSGFLKILTKLILRVLALLAIFWYLALVLSLFPLTRKLGTRMWGWFGSQLERFSKGFIDYLPNLMTILLIVVIAYCAIRFSRFFFSALSRGVFTLPGFYPEWAQPTHQLLTFAIVALAFASSYFYLPNAESPAFQGVSIFLGALVSFGATNAISNIFAGITLIYTRAFIVGDRVEVADKLGDIEDRTLLVTRIRTVNRELVTIPNSILLSSSIVNYSALIRETHTSLTLQTTITIGYDVPWRELHNVLIAAALATTDILDNPKPFVLQTSLDDYYVSYRLKAFTNHPERMQFIYSELHQNIQDKCNEAGIEIMSPHYTTLRDGNRTTIPENYLPPDYTTPGFQIDSQMSPIDPSSRASDNLNSSNFP
ncbi:mechanosensitive ion channel family protein [Myxosarcina sp. GI1]|uniref:mechanosensitive ion channel family protein n=1 Tax=Myxosarcina sp. GI1 TaxID=1541065 RepID=UPI0005692447|nr:mechanosensitive ion channel family protein [Myxosarcina sp. GI1]